MSSHFSTHIDAPRHFSPRGWTVDQIPKENLCGPGVVVDVQQQAAMDRNYAVKKQDILEHERKYGMIPHGAIVFFNTGWNKYWRNTEWYLGMADKDLSKQQYPGLSKEGAEFLVNERYIVGIGSDTISLDSAKDKSYGSHNVLADANKWGIECTANLHLLPPNGFEVYVHPLKLSGASGAPTNILAFL